MQIIVGTSAQKVVSGGRQRPVVQNLGPGTIFLDTEGSVTPTTGIKIPVGWTYEFPTSGSEDDIWIISDTASTDVRVIQIG